MARKGSKTKVVKNHRGLYNVKRLWKTVLPEEWLEVFKELAPQHKWRMQGLSTIKALCPYHDESDASFVLSFNKGMGKCFGSCGKYVGDLVALTAKLRGCDYLEALIFLYSRLNLDKVIGGDEVNDLSEYSQIQAMKREAAKAMNKIILEVLRDDPDHLAYCRPAVYYLINVRKIPKEVIHAMPVGIYAKPLHLQKHMPTAEYHPLMEEYFKKYEGMRAWGSICFPYNDSVGTISRFKYRRKNDLLLHGVKTFEDLEKIETGKQREIFTREFVYMDDPYNSDITSGLGLFGLHKYQALIGRNTTDAYVTEGEFDALSIMAQQVLNSTPDFIMLASGGKGATDVSLLDELDIKTVWLVGDHPTAKGDEYVMSILQNKKNFASAIHGAGLRFKVFQWPKGLKGSDLDEAVLMNGYGEVRKYLNIDRESYFLNHVPWIKVQCDSEIASAKEEAKSSISALTPASDSYPLECSNIENDKLENMKTIIVKWMRYLHDSSDKKNFAQGYARDEGIDVSLIEKVQASMYAQDFTGAVEQVISALQKHFNIAYFEKNNSQTNLKGWAIEQEYLMDFYLSEKALLRELAIFLKTDLVTWLDSVLGDNPVYLEEVKGKPLADHLAKKKAGLNIILSAIAKMCKEAKNIEKLTPLSHGVHRINDERVYFANGKVILVGKYLDPETGAMEWKRLDNVVDGDLIFENIRANEQWSSITSPEDLQPAHQVNLKQLFGDVRTILGGWKFEHDEVIGKYLAAYILSIPIMAAVGNVNITLVTGEAESGKTSLVNGLLGGRKKNFQNTFVPPILESAIATGDISAAGMYQRFSRSSLLFVLDEAEDSEDTKHDIRVKELLRMLFPLMMTGVQVDRGGITADQRSEYYLNMPVLCAAIRPLTNPVFLSRVFRVHTVKELGRQNLDEYIFDRYPAERIEEIRRQVTSGLIPWIPKIRAIRKRLREDLAKVKDGDVQHGSNRFLDIVLTPLAVYELIEGDAEGLYRELLRAFKDELQRIHVGEGSSEVVDTCFYSPYFQVTSDLDEHMREQRSARDLILAGHSQSLNDLRGGVYHIPDCGISIILWKQAKHTVLKGWWSRRSIDTLRENAFGCPFVVQDVTPELHEKIKSYLGLADLQVVSDYIVVDDAFLGYEKSEGVPSVVKGEATCEVSPEDIGQNFAM